MNNKNLLKLHNFFERVQDLDYVTVRMSENFPDYEAGSDVDILSANEKEFARRVLAEGNGYIADGLEMRVSAKSDARHIKIAFYRGGELHFMFDIHGSLPRFQKIRFKPEYFRRILDERRQVTAGGAKTYIPSELDELILRYAEYHELFERRPDKVKHYEAVAEALSGTAKVGAFAERLHRYLKLWPETDEARDEAPAYRQPPDAADRRTRFKNYLRNYHPKVYRLALKLRRLMPL